MISGGGWEQSSQRECTGSMYDLLRPRTNRNTATGAEAAPEPPPRTQDGEDTTGDASPRGTEGQDAADQGLGLQGVHDPWARYCGETRGQAEDRIALQLAIEESQAEEGATAERRPPQGKGSSRRWPDLESAWQAYNERHRAA